MFHYYKQTEPPEDFRDTATATLKKGLDTVTALMEDASRALAFPGYSGKNFDAFWDSVRVLDGINAKRVRLVHPDVPGLEADDLTTYVGLLRDAVMYWKRPGRHEHIMEVWFPESDRERIEALLRTIPPYEDESAP